MVSSRSCVLPYLVLAMLPSPAVSMRSAISASALARGDDEHTFGSHAHGCEEEHDHFGEGMTWAVTEKDKMILSQIEQALNAGNDVDNPPVEWTWQDERASWMFPIVKLGEEDAQGNLALHMLHRHGLGALLASRGGQVFQDQFQNKLEATGLANSSGVEKAKALVETIEQFSSVSVIRQFMADPTVGLTLSGLRNLHSWDHSWSVETGKNTQLGCEQENAGACVLQAGHSRHTYNFLHDNGFSNEVSESLKQKQGDIIKQILEVRRKHSEIANVYSTGEITLDLATYDMVRDKGSNVFFKSLVAGSNKAVVDVNWEDGGSTTLDIPVDEVLKAKLVAAGSGFMAVLKPVVYKHLEELLGDHKQYMQKHRLDFWGGEVADFVEMHPRLNTK